ERKRSRLIPSPSLDSGNSLCYRTPPAQPAGAKISGRIAQLVEQLTLNQRVPGSSPGAPTNKSKDLAEIRGVQRSWQNAFGHAFGHTSRGTQNNAPSAFLRAVAALLNRLDRIGGQRHPPLIAEQRQQHLDAPARFHAGIDRKLPLERPAQDAYGIAE